MHSHAWHELPRIVTYSGGSPAYASIREVFSPEPRAHFWRKRYTNLRIWQTRNGRCMERNARARENDPAEKFVRESRMGRELIAGERKPNDTDPIECGG